jgi:hypothetical protein
MKWLKGYSSCEATIIIKTEKRIRKRHIREKRWRDKLVCTKLKIKKIRRGKSRQATVDRKRRKEIEERQPWDHAVPKREPQEKKEQKNSGYSSYVHGQKREQEKK